MNPDDVVEHAGKYAYYFLIGFPVEAGLVRKRIIHQARQVNGTQQAGAVFRQALFTTWVGRTYFFTEPVIVHLVVFINEDESRFCIFIG